MSEELNTQEKAYFESGGEQEIPSEPTVTPVDAAPSEPTTLVVQPGQGEVTTTEPEKPDVVTNLNKALKETRVQNRELRNKLAELERAQQEYNQRLEQAQQKLGIGEKPVTMDDNPAEFLHSEIKQTKEQLAALQQEKQQQTHMAQFQNWYAAQAQQFSATKPDFGAAYAAYNQGRVEQLIDAGLTQEKAVERLRYEEMQIASTAAQTGLNPAQMIYQMALARGYTGAQKPLQAAPSLDTVRKGVEASKPLSQVGGGGKTENLTWEAIAEMPDSEFKSAWDKMAKAEGH